MKQQLINRTYSRRYQTIIWLLYALGLLFRIVFLLYGARLYYGTENSIHFNGDSYSYMKSFENLLHTGYYTFDFLTPDAAFGRLPGYPFFYGIHYLIFGAKLAPIAIAWTQTILDSFGVLLLFGILRQIFPAVYSAPLVGAALYACYPFIIIWTPIVGTEALSTSLTLWWLFCLLRFRSSVAYGLGIGLLLAVLFYIREYLGILLPISIVYLLISNRLFIKENVIALFQFQIRMTRWRSVVLVCLGFGMLYCCWPARNYLSYHRIMLAKPKTAGYAAYGPDMDNFRSWVQCWTNDENPWINKVLHTPNVQFPKEVFANTAEEAYAQQLVQLAKECGFSFYFTRNNLQARAEYSDTLAMRHNAEYQAMLQKRCDRQIGDGFARLQQSYRMRHPIAYYLDVPLKNIYKAFFKSSTAQNHDIPFTAKVLAMWLLFSYRSLVLLLGVIGLVIFRHQRELWPVALFFSFIYLFISFVIRGLEMRYLIQVDVLMLIPAAALIGSWCDSLLKRLDSKVI